MDRTVAISLLIVVVTACAVTGCDRGTDDDTSPTVTYRGAGSSGDQQQREEPPPSDDDSDVTPPQQPQPMVGGLPEGDEQQQQLLLEGRTAFLNGDYEQAEEVFEQLAFDDDVSADTVSAAIALGQIYVETGRPDEALQMYEQLEEHVQDVPEVLLVVARGYARAEEHQQAIDTYEQVYLEEPSYIFVLPELAELLVGQGQNERAGEVIAEYEYHVVDLSSQLEDSDETPEYERIYIVDIFSWLDDERAFEALEQAAENDPSEQVRAQAALALGEAAAFDRRDILEQLARDDDSEIVRVAAERAVGMLDEFED